jgi:phage terminase large subunit-like protein
VTRGGTRDNRANLPARFIADVEREFGGTLLARQELDGELLEDLPGALWTRAARTVPRWRGASDDAGGRGRRSARLAQGDACGIVVCGLGEDGSRACWPMPRSAGQPRTLGRCRARNGAGMGRGPGGGRSQPGRRHGGRGAARGQCHAAAAAGPCQPGKVARAEPVAALYEAGRVRHAGMFARLEDELCGLMPGGAYQGPGRSPDRADACVWALTELMLGRAGEPRVWFD